MTARKHACDVCGERTTETLRICDPCQEAATDKGLVEALRAAESVLWMAQEYVERGGCNGNERRDFEAAGAKVKAALKAVRS